jgi:hypothetical protein
VFLEVFRLLPADLDQLTGQQLRELADRADEIVRAMNRSAEQNGAEHG